MPRHFQIFSQSDNLIQFLIEIHIFNDKQCRSRSADLDLHCLLKQGMSRLAREWLKGEHRAHLDVYENRILLNNGLRDISSVVHYITRGKVKEEYLAIVLG